jgi:flagella basal body P-ring formation protein FlgA
MNTKKLNSAIAVFVLTVIVLSQSDARAEKKMLQVYLPRNAIISGEVALLRDVAVLKGDEAKIANAGEISLGKISRPGAEITIDKQVLRSRLASNGIYASEVVITGAESVVIGRKGYVIKSEEFLAAAEQEIVKLSKDSSICRWKAAWIPKEFAVDGAGDDVKLIARLVSNGSQSQVRATVAVTQNGKELCVREVAFNAQYKNQRAVAATDIQSGTAISSDNVHIETYESAIPQQGYVQPYGLAAKRQIKAGSVIIAEMLESTKSPVLVSRNHGVVIQIKQPGLLITAMGQALEDGRAKECVKVRNLDSQRVLLARVNDDGTVEPVY